MKKPYIIAFINDLMFSSKIERVAHYLNYQIEWIEQEADLGKLGAETAPSDKIAGRTTARHNRAIDGQSNANSTGLLLFDLTNQAIPWQSWIPSLKNAAATRRIPIMCYGPHVDADLLKKAKGAGADVVLPRSRFAAKMPDLFQEYLHQPDQVALEKGCSDPLPTQVKQAIELFNQGEYYRCHDALETAWRDEQEPVRNLYHGILQVGIAYFQIERGNYRGAVKMLLRVRQWLNPLPDVCQGVAVAELREGVTAVYNHLTHLGPAQIDNFDRNLFQSIIAK